MVVQITGSYMTGDKDDHDDSTRRNILEPEEHLCSARFDCEGLFPGFPTCCNAFLLSRITNLLYPTVLYVLYENIQVRNKTLFWAEAVCKG